jgi:hypothetical protein
VLLLIFFIFACLGMNLFSKVKHGDNLHEWSNFESFFMSMLLLFRMCTGESYNGVMHDAMIQPPECNDANADQSNCGFPESAPIFFLAFFVLSGMLLLNICVAIILDNFGESASEGELPVTEADREKFKDMWAEFDPGAEGAIAVDDLEKLVGILPEPLGCRSTPYIKWPRTDDEIEVMNRDNKLSLQDPAVKQEAANIILGMDMHAHGGKATFQETLSFLVARAADAVLAEDDRHNLLSSEQFADLQQKKNRLPTVRKAQKELAKSDSRYTVQEVQATKLVQKVQRGRSVRKEVGQKVSRAQGTGDDEEQLRPEGSSS